MAFCGLAGLWFYGLLLLFIGLCWFGGCGWVWLLVYCGVGFGCDLMTCDFGCFSGGWLGALRLFGAQFLVASLFVLCVLRLRVDCGDI